MLKAPEPLGQCPERVEISGVSGASELFPIRDSAEKFFPSFIGNRGLSRRRAMDREEEKTETSL